MIEFIFYGEFNLLLQMQPIFLKEFHFIQHKAILHMSFPTILLTLVFHLLKLHQYKEGTKLRLLWDRVAFYKDLLFIISPLIKIIQFFVISKTLHYQVVLNVIMLVLLLWPHTDILFQERHFLVMEQVLQYQILVTFQFNQLFMVLQEMLFQFHCILHWLLELQ